MSEERERARGSGKLIDREERRVARQEAISPFHSFKTILSLQTKCGVKYNSNVDVTGDVVLKEGWFVSKKKCSA